MNKQECVKAHKKLCNELIEIEYLEGHGMCGRQMCEYELNVMYQLIEEYQKLERALDKACAELENLSYVKGLGQLGKNYNEWKEWCFKDE